MRVNVHIERLVVEGLAMTIKERRGFDAALRSELARLLAGSGMQAVSGMALSALIGPDVRLGREASASQWGEQIASAVHVSLVHPRPVRNPGPAAAPLGREEVIHDGPGIGPSDSATRGR